MTTLPVRSYTVKMNLIMTYRELRMQRFYLTFLHKMSFLAQMVQKVT